MLPASKVRAAVMSIVEYIVPEEFRWDTVHAKPLRGGPLYRLKQPGFVANEHAAFALGVGKAALAEVVSLAQSKRRGFTPSASSLEARATFQRNVGLSDLRTAVKRGTLTPRLLARSTRSFMVCYVIYKLPALCIRVPPDCYATRD